MGAGTEEILATPLSGTGASARDWGGAAVTAASNSRRDACATHVFHSPHRVCRLWLAAARLKVHGRWRPCHLLWGGHIVRPCVIIPATGTRSGCSYGLRPGRVCVDAHR